MDFDPAGFEWVDCKRFRAQRDQLPAQGQEPEDHDCCLSVTSLRCPGKIIASACPRDGYWREILNSDAPLYGGSGQGNIGGVAAVRLPIHGRPDSLNLTLPPLGVVVFKPESRGGA